VPRTGALRGSGVVQKHQIGTCGPAHQQKIQTVSKAHHKKIEFNLQTFKNCYKLYTMRRTFSIKFEKNPIGLKGLIFNSPVIIFPLLLSYKINTTLK